jgi:hypothetical protein
MCIAVTALSGEMGWGAGGVCAAWDGCAVCGAMDRWGDDGSAGAGATCLGVDGAGEQRCRLCLVCGLMAGWDGTRAHGRA